MSKVTLILADGMRPDALLECTNPFTKEFLQNATLCIKGQSVMPSVTLPCHMSLFHSVKPERHGTTTNIYMPQVRPIKGLCETMLDQGKRSAMFYSWGELRDLVRPGYNDCSLFYPGRAHGYYEAGEVLTKEAIEYTNKFDPDFLFLYLGETDAVGHSCGWMGEEYKQAMDHSVELVKKYIENTSSDRNVIFTADHGGHDRHHGLDIPEDMEIPFVFYGPDFKKGQQIEGVSLLDICPTVAKLLGINPNEEWEGNCII